MEVVSYSVVAACESSLSVTLTSAPISNPNKLVGLLSNWSVLKLLLGWEAGCVASPQEITSHNKWTSWFQMGSVQETVSRDWFLGARSSCKLRNDCKQCLRERSLYYITDWEGTEFLCFPQRVSSVPGAGKTQFKAQPLGNYCGPSFTVYIFFLSTLDSQLSPNFLPQNSEESTESVSRILAPKSGQRHLYSELECCSFTALVHSDLVI